MLVLFTPCEQFLDSADFYFLKVKGSNFVFFFCVVKNYSDGCRNKGLFRVEIASCRRSCPRAKIMNAGVTHQLPLLINKLIWEDRDGQKNLIRFDQGPSTSVYLLGELRIENFSSGLHWVGYQFYSLEQITSCVKSQFSKYFLSKEKLKFQFEIPKSPFCLSLLRVLKIKIMQHGTFVDRFMDEKVTLLVFRRITHLFSQHLKHIPLKMKKNKRRRSFGTIEYRQEKGLILETFKPKFPILTILILLLPSMKQQEYSQYKPKYPEYNFDAEEALTMQAVKQKGRRTSLPAVLIPPPKPVLMEAKLGRSQLSNFDEISVLAF